MQETEKGIIDCIKKFSALSKAKRLKVCAALVYKGEMVNFKVNHNYLGKECEYRGKTLPEVMHAEEAIILEAMELGYKLENYVLYVTHEPCLNCARLILFSGLKNVVFIEKYTGSNDSGYDFLKRTGINIQQYGKKK